MSLQYVEQSVLYPPQVILARGGGNQGPGTRITDVGAGRPSKKAAKKAPKKAAKKAAKKKAVKKAPKTKKK